MGDVLIAIFILLFFIGVCVWAGRFLRACYRAGRNAAPGGKRPVK